MANISITNNDVGALVLERGTFSDELLTLAGAGTIKAGTILARSTATLKLVKYVKGGSTNGNGVPCCVLPYEVVAAGAGDVAVRVAMSGKMNQNRLVIDADGDDSNVDGAVRDQLRARNFELDDVQQLARLDNPQPTESDS
jgi:hypothetical protein